MSHEAEKITVHVKGDGTYQKTVEKVLQQPAHNAKNSKANSNILKKK